jgi:CubicO group peptidase (beta-lactamase class C family)
MKHRLFCIVLAIAVIVAPGRGSAQEEFPYQIFERYLEPLIQQIGMPGLSAVIVQGGRIAWEKSYGFADVEQQVHARIDTPYPVGGVTQAVTGVLVGVCIDRFGFEIDEGIRETVPAFPIAGTSVRQVLSHATDGRFRYDAALYSSLTSVVQSKKCFDKSYRQAAAVEVFDRLAMTRSVPSIDLNRADGVGARAQFSETAVNRYQAVLREAAVPYRIDTKGRSFRSDYPEYGVDAATGLVSTAYDLALFEMELDKRNGVPLSRSTLEKMWSNASFTIPNPAGGSTTVVMPTGLGWFVTKESNVDLVWTFGHIPNAGSALILRMPQKRLTLIMLANSPGLAQGYNLENASVTASPFVKVFLRLFI